MTINCKGNLVDLKTPKIMGILNLTPDSFYDGGKHTAYEAIFNHVGKMLHEGATFIDLGGYSSRPGANFVSEKEELNRVLPVLSALIERFPDAYFSVDTFRSKVAREAVQIGAALINDIFAGNGDLQMFSTIAELQVPYIMMHIKGTPKTMQQKTQYKNILEEISFYFSEKIAYAHHLGINDLILDPGFGFAKNIPQNFELLRKMNTLNNFGYPILTGLSRKSMIYKTLEIFPKEALNGTTVLNTIALQQGASILRVHDVKEAQQCLQLVQHLYEPI